MGPKNLLWTLANPTIQEWYNLSCLKTLHISNGETGGRNILRGPNTRQLDFSVFKKFPVSTDGTRTFEFRAESFNLPNHPNFAVPSGLIAFTGVDANGNPVIAPNWGVISSTVTTSRQIQFGLKFMF